jgi:retron-type reverse transcriptase
MRLVKWREAGKSMVKRVGNLFESLVSFENLYMAWKKARQGTGWTHETRQFFYQLEPALLGLQAQLINQTYTPGRFRYFHIRDPKPRIIAVAPFRDRIVHHALTQLLMPVFEQTFIADSYATREGKGTHKAIVKAQKLCRRYPWYYKMDIEHFFETVDQTLMYELVARKIKDKRVLALSKKIIHNPPGERGLPIGNLTSQFFANIYLNPLDHFIKQDLHIKGYVRYMDDFIVFLDEKEALKRAFQQIEQFIHNVLKLKLKKSGYRKNACCLNQSRHGLSFLGYRIFPGMLRHIPTNYQRSKKKMASRIKAYERGYIAEQQLADSLHCITAHLHHFCR